jgi:hypothetical protein
MKHPRLPSVFALVLAAALLWGSHSHAQLVTPKGSAITDSKTGLSYRAKVLAMTKANTGTHDMTALAEDTDFFVHSESGSDFLVTITDQSANSAFALVNHKE